MDSYGYKGKGSYAYAEAASSEILLESYMMFVFIRVPSVRAQFILIA